MILHAVYLSLADNAKPDELAEIMTGLDKLVGQIDGFVAFAHGPNIDVEAKSPEAQYGFQCSFVNRTALDRYAADPRHRVLGGRLVSLCGGAAGIKVYDLEIGD